jgi:hypothetical protein
MGIITAGLALAWVLTVAPVDAQLRSSGQPRGIGPTGSRPSVETPQDAAAPVLRNQWLQGDERQQEQLVGCYRLSATLANHARDIRKMLVAGEVDWKGVTGQYEDLDGAALRVLSDEDLRKPSPDARR